jgi:hypothetical protein
VVGSTMSTREEVVAQMAQYADTEVISLRDLEKLFVQVATALNKAGMKELAKDAAARAFEGGMETFGDLRAVTTVWLEDRAGMREFDASALSKVIAEAQHVPKTAQPAAHEDEQEDNSGEVNPEGGEGSVPEVDHPKQEAGSGSETQSADQSQVSVALTQVAAVLLDGQRALIEASRRTTRGKVETLKKEDGLRNCCRQSR